MSNGKPLEGLKVVELGTHFAIPAVARMMADWGAEVIKVEGLSGEALASALRCLQAIKALDDAKAPADAAVILEKNA